MKMLFDENLSPALVDAVSDLYPQSVHVGQFLGVGATDTRVWDAAANPGFTIVSKDNDFRQRSFVYGHPPKVIWLSIGNSSTNSIIQLPRERRDDLLRFDADAEAALLVVNRA